MKNILDLTKKVLWIIFAGSMLSLMYGPLFLSVLSVPLELLNLVVTLSSRIIGG